MNQINCSKKCRLYKTDIIPVGSGGRADLGIFCLNYLVTQVVFRRGRNNNLIEAEYNLNEKAENTLCISLELRKLI